MRSVARSGCSRTRATRHGRTGLAARARDRRDDPERDDQIIHRRKRPGRPIDVGDRQRERYRGRNVVERCFNTLKQWRGIAMRSDKTARNYHAGLCLAATLHWLTTAVRNSPLGAPV